MTDVPKYVPREGDTLRDADPWIRAMTAAVAGRATRTFSFNSDHPPTVTIPGTSRPAGITVLAASQPRGVGSVISGAPVTWTWAPSSTGGAIIVKAITGLTASTDYDVTIEIVGS